MASASATKQEFATKIHAANGKMLATMTESLKVKSVGAKASGSTGFAKVYMEADSTTCTEAQTSTYYTEYGHCLMNYDSTYTMYDWAANDDGSYNQTTMEYSDATCDTMTGSYISQYPGTCATAVGADGTYFYVMGLQSSYKSGKAWGTHTYNTETACSSGKDSDVMTATEMYFKTCYETGGYSISVTSCGKYSLYATSDCSGDAMNDDSYSDDSYFYGDDDSNECVVDSNDDDAAEPEEYEADFCTSAASMVSPSAFAMFAASAMAAFAML
jgi:hypothetical protein